MRFGLRYAGDRRALRALAQRQELVRAGLTRRDLVKMGLVTGGGVGGGLLVAEKGLAAQLRSPGALGALPPLEPFALPLKVLPPLPERRVTELDPPPGVDPNNKAINPQNGLPFEGRTERHQSGDRFPVQT